MTTGEKPRRTWEALWTKVTNCRVWDGGITRVGVMYADVMWNIISDDDDLVQHR